MNTVVWGQIWSQPSNRLCTPLPRTEGPDTAGTAGSRVSVVNHLHVPAEGNDIYGL